MSIVLTINANSAEELVAQVRELQSAMLGSVSITKEALTPIQTGAMAAQSAANTEKPKATRASKPKDTPVAETSKAEETQAETHADPNQSPLSGGKTKGDVSAALQALTAAKDIDTAKKVLAQFKNAGGTACARMSDLQEKDYEDFIATCEAEAK